MEELPVIENLIEGNRAPLRVRRALACVSRLHAGALTRLFRERVLHLAECDCTWPNHVFVRKRLQRAISRFGGAGPPWPQGRWYEQLPVIQVEGERVLGPAIHTDDWYWNAAENNWPLQLANVQKATVFFLSRALAELQVAHATVGYGTLQLPIGMLQNALPVVHAKLEQHRPLGPELYQFISGVSEVFALREKRIVMNMKHRMLSDDAVPNVAHHIKKHHQTLQSLDLSMTDPWFYCNMCLARHLFERTGVVFHKLHTLKLSCVTLAQPGMEPYGVCGLGQALRLNRLPRLQILGLKAVGLDDTNVKELAPGLTVQRGTLRELDFNDNQLGHFGLQRITDALAMSPTLNRLSIAGNPLTPGALERLAQLIKIGNFPEIRVVDFHFTQQGYNRAHCVIAIALKCSKSQREWDRFVRSEERRGSPLGSDA